MEHPGGITAEIGAKLYYGPAVDGHTTPQDTLKALEVMRSASQGLRCWLRLSPLPRTFRKR